MTTVGTIEYDVRIKISDFSAQAKQLENEAAKAGERTGNALSDGTKNGLDKNKKHFEDFKSNVVTAARGATVAAGLFAGKAVQSAASFETQLSRLRYASSATGDEMTRMTKLANNLANDNTLAGISASDAAAAMIELSKAGLSVNDVIGSSKSVLSLAKAGNIEFADAAVFTASALNAFSMSGKDANKVADALAAGAGASQAEVYDLAQGLQQSATVAKQFGLSLNENVTALSLFAKNGIQGSDAGTSLKTMLIALAKPSKESASAMQAIGFSAYDAQGNFVDLGEMSKRLKKSLSGLTQEQKQNTLATIFGTDAFRAAGILADNAGESYDDMSEKVKKVGAAQEAAAANQGETNKGWEDVNNSVSTLALNLGTLLLPAINDTAQGIKWWTTELNNGNPFIVAATTAIVALAGAVAIAPTITTTVKALSFLSTIALPAASAAVSGVSTMLTFLSTVTLPAASAAINGVKATFTAFSAVLSIPLVMPAIAVAAAIAALSTVIAKHKETQKVIEQTNSNIRNNDNVSRQTDAAMKKRVDEGKISQEAYQKYLKNTSKVGEDEANKLKQQYSGAIGSINHWLDSLMGSASAKKYDKLKKERGWATGGYTGRGAVNEIAGLVHKGEYVLPQSMVDQASGLPNWNKIFQSNSVSAGSINAVPQSGAAQTSPNQQFYSYNTIIDGVTADQVNRSLINQARRATV